LGRDLSWSSIDGELCLVVAFEPFGEVVGEKVKAPPVPMPYANLTIVCSKLDSAVTWPVSHRVDFVHLWQAFRVRPLDVDEEIMVVWSSSDRTGSIERVFASFLPRINVMVYPKGSYANFNGPTWNERVRGETWALAMEPLASWRVK
jgi:hypothetical protein